VPPAVIAAGIMGGTSLAGGLMNRGNKKQDQQMMLMQQQQAQRQSSLANTISGFANKQFTMGEPAMQKAMQYYSSLLSGGRGGMQSAIAPEVGMINDNYRGAERGMMARMAPGGVRDNAIADLYRQRTGQIGSLGHTARSGAVQNLGNIGQGLIGNALNAYGAAGNALSGASGTYGDINRLNMQRQQGRDQMWQGFGTSMGQILLPYLMGQTGGAK